MGPNFGTVSHLRAGDPAAIAIAVFEQGCINQREGTAQAGVAASVRLDPQAAFGPGRPGSNVQVVSAMSAMSVMWTHAACPTLLLSARSREMSTP
jgi:hypothetical protein